MNSNTYTHSSKKYARTSEEAKQIRSDLNSYYELIKKDLTSECDYDIIARALLDSSLISQTNVKKYQIKILECGDYIQVYDYNYLKIKKDKKLIVKRNYYTIPHKTIIDNKYIYKNKLENCVIDNDLKINMYNSFGLERILKINIIKNRGSPTNKIIDIKNINRAKASLQRLIKTNETQFKTFVTLTFAENVKDVNEAHKKFNIWRTYIKKLKSDFKYVAVPEFQKRGAVHYHLLTNIDYTDFNLLSKELVITYSKKTRSYDKGRTIKGWKYGYSKVKNMDNVNVVGYLTKYLVKDLDNRLWGKRRYYYSHNLLKPKEILLNLSNINDFKLYIDLLDNDKLYESFYSDKLGQVINFYEYKKKELI